MHTNSLLGTPPVAPNVKYSLYQITYHHMFTTTGRAQVSTRDGARSTTFGRFHDALNGINDHSSGLPGRCVVTRSTELENEWPGLPTDGEPAEFAEKRSAILRKHREEVERAGGDGPEWGTVWAGAAVGLVTKVRYRAAKCRQLQQP